MKYASNKLPIYRISFEIYHKLESNLTFHLLFSSNETHLEKKLKRKDVEKCGNEKYEINFLTTESCFIEEINL